MRASWRLCKFCLVFPNLAGPCNPKQATYLQSFTGASGCSHSHGTTNTTGQPLLIMLVGHQGCLGQSKLPFTISSLEVCCKTLRQLLRAGTLDCNLEGSMVVVGVKVGELYL